MDGLEKCLILSNVGFFNHSVLVAQPQPYLAKQLQPCTDIEGMINIKHVECNPGFSKILQYLCFIVEWVVTKTPVLTSVAVLYYMCIQTNPG